MPRLEEELPLSECLELSDLSLRTGNAGTAGRALICWGSGTCSLLPEDVVTARLDSGVPWGVNPDFGSILMFRELEIFMTEI